MSWQATAWAVSQQTGSPTRKVVLLALSNYADDIGCAWPSQVRLATETETSERTVRRTLADLERMGLIARVRRRERGKELTTVYRLAMPVAKLAGGDGAKKPAVKMTGGSKKPPAKLTGGDGANRRPMAPKTAGQAMADEPSVNRQQAAAGKARRTTKTGMVVWTTNDHAEAQRLEASVPLADLRAAVAALADKDKDPLPGRVAAILAAQDRARHQAERRQAAETQRHSVQADAAIADPELIRSAEQAYPAVARMRRAMREGRAPC